MKHIVVDTYTHWKNHKAQRMGAALSYYTTFSLVPLLLLLIIVSGAFFTRATVEHTLITQMTKAIGANATNYIYGLLDSTQLKNTSVLATVISAVTVILGSIGIFSELDNDLDQLWESVPKPSKKPTTFFGRVWNIIYTKLILISLIPILAALLIIAVGVTVFFSLIKAKIGIFAVLIPLLQILIPLVLLTIFCMIIYRLLPDRKVPIKMLFVGALVTAVLFIIGNIVITLYLKLLVHTNTFGSASSLVGLLVWIYYSAQVFLLGASFTYVYGKKKHFIHVHD